MMTDFQAGFKGSEGVFFGDASHRCTTSSLYTRKDKHTRTFKLFFICSVQVIIVMSVPLTCTILGHIHSKVVDYRGSGYSFPVTIDNKH